MSNIKIHSKAERSAYGAFRKNSLELYRLGIEVFSYHERDLKGYRMLELAKVKSRKLADLLKTLYKSVSVNVKLSRRFGNVEVIFKECLNRHKSLAVKGFK